MKLNHLAPPTRLLFLVALSVVLMVADSRTDGLRQIRSFVTVIALPVHLVAAAPALFHRWVTGDLTHWAQFRKQHEELQRRNLILQSRLQRLEALETENDRLRDLISLSQRESEEVLFGEIVGVELDPYTRTVLVNRGNADGVFVGQPVLDPKGVIGQVIRTGLFRSSVALITDPSQGIPVQLARNSLRTILYGVGQGDLLRAPYLGRTADVRKGDLLVTSGMAGRFPVGYPVAKVIEIKRDLNAPFLDVVVEPVAGLASAREVLLVWPDTNDTSKLGSTSEHQ